MVEKLKTNKSLQRIFVLMSCAVVLFLAFAPTANAFLIDPTLTKFETILSGDMTIQYYPTNGDEVSSYVSRIYSVGGMLPYPATTGSDLYGEVDEDFLLSSTTDPDWNFLSEIRIGRYKDKITFTNGSSFTFDTARYKMNMYDISGSSYVPAAYRSIKFDFDPMFFESYDSSVLGLMFTLRLSQPVTIKTTVVYSWYDDDSGTIQTMTNTNIDERIGNSNIVEFNAFNLFVTGNHETALLKNVPEYSAVFIESATVEIQPLDYTSTLNHVQFEMMGQTYLNGTPKYIPRDSVTRWVDYVASHVASSGSSGGIVLPEVEANIFTRWLAGAAGGFLDAELLPGFSFGGLFKVIVTVLFVRVILKFLGGG